MGNYRPVSDAAMDWDLSAYFPAFGGEPYAAFVAELELELATALQRAAELPPLDASTGSIWEGAVLGYESLSGRLHHLSSYVRALRAADGNDPRYRAATARVDGIGGELRKLRARLRRGCGEAEASPFERWIERPALASARDCLCRLREEARRSMSLAQEELAADLELDGLTAWGRLYDALTSTLEFDLVEASGESRRLPLSARRALLEDRDRGVRLSAFEGGNRALEPLLSTLCAALNHIAGARLTLWRRRGYGHFLEPALREARIGEDTLQAMLEGVGRERPLIQRILREKARRMGLQRLHWVDLGAPMPPPPGASGAAEVGASPLSWQEGCALAQRALDATYPALGAFFEKVIALRWVDHTPRRGKRPGAFCTSSPLIGESRVFMTFQGTSGNVSTLVHEVGHAFHSSLLSSERVLSRAYPNTLAESASTFAELLLAEGLMRDARAGEPTRRAGRDQTLVDACLFTTDLVARFEFERAFYERRQRGLVPVEELCEMMSRAQLEAVGPSLDPEAADPYYWASKLHFFITRVSFYNFPYTFGHLLSRSLHAELQRRGPEFLPAYEELLRGSGRAPVEELCERTLGVSLREPEFWQRAIASLGDPVLQLEQEAR